MEELQDTIRKTLADRGEDAYAWSLIELAAHVDCLAKQIEAIEREKQAQDQRGDGY